MNEIPEVRDALAGEIPDVRDALERLTKYGSVRIHGGRRNWSINVRLPGTRHDANFHGRTLRETFDVALDAFDTNTYWDFIA